MTCPDIVEKLAGYSKIKMCCQTASEQDIEWVWIDTCCIDKTSSSALQEAINSMFRWYQKATICYAYLSDVPGELNEREREDCFHESQWFSRGWTLQELIAPQEVWFYDQTWTKCGTKISYKRLLSEITGIQQKVLEGTTELSEYSVAQKMCWASRRITTRQEDMAYCLLGIFDINMSLIYGEGGPKAFIRLQEQIMQDSDDQSIFAWESELSPRTTAFGLLANSPALFKKVVRLLL
ncbi:hypothetical protein NA56DRAFT_587952 [Hyaloscypha hepaticicola]|uniref:Uncharacterized protein n=1 Tax=Hyaloscypha hepaticicola TaxID=2082293 RepID=A0A2J6PDD2_9HELO|nr:hypothetical protein NA56DRAFT_587952 [Hyaloscypha hepaticicola]